MSSQYVVCGDNRFKIIEKAKQDLLRCTNIDTHKEEMDVLDDFLFRCWQMGWLDQYDVPSGQIPLDYQQVRYERDVAFDLLERNGIRWEPREVTKE